MRRPSVEILSPGPLSTIQDAGRYGFKRYGISTSGVVDKESLLLGNLLLDNDPESAAIEITFGGFEARFLGDTAIVLTGADLTASLDGIAVSTYEVVYVKFGQHLELPGPGSGMRAYISIVGGFNTPKHLGSRSTYLAARLGIFNGRSLMRGDVIPCGTTDGLPFVGRRTSTYLSHDYPEEVTIRVVPGPQDDCFTESGLNTFFGAPYTVSDQIDRQGIRLDGPEIQAVDNRHDIVSDAVVTGSIQIPGNRKPIVLLADCQTTGGYPKIGVVATIDHPLLAQVIPGTKIKFKRVTIEDAQKEIKIRSKMLKSSEFIDASPTIRRVAICGKNYAIKVPATGLSGRKRARLQIEVGGIPYAVDVDKKD